MPVHTKLQHCTTTRRPTPLLILKRHGIIYGIISEGQSAYYLDGNWVGLEYLEGGKGYWFKTFDDASC